MGWKPKPQYVQLSCHYRIVRPITEEERQRVRWLARHYVELAQKYASGAFESL